MKVVGRFAWPLFLSGNPRQLWIRCQSGQAMQVAERLKAFRGIQVPMVTSGSSDIYADFFPF